MTPTNGRPADRRRFLETSRSKLTLAVRLTDAFTGAHLRNARLSLVDREESFGVNPSGYHVLTDLPADVSSVTVDVDAGKRYLPERREVDLDTLDPSSPVETIDLLPAPAYRFPASATVLRGVVRDATGDPLADADLTVDGWPVETRSDDGGTFALYFEGLTPKDVAEGSNGRTVAIDGDDPTVVANHSEVGTTSKTVAVVERTTTSVEIQF